MAKKLTPEVNLPRAGANRVKVLRIQPDQPLVWEKWNKQEIERIESSIDNYAKYRSALTTRASLQDLGKFVILTNGILLCYYENIKQQLVF